MTKNLQELATLYKDCYILADNEDLKVFNPKTNHCLSFELVHNAEIYEPTIHEFVENKEELFGRFKILFHPTRKELTEEKVLSHLFAYCDNKQLIKIHQAMNQWILGDNTDKEFCKKVREIIESTLTK